MRDATPNLTIGDPAFAFEHLSGGSFVSGAGGRLQADFVVDGATGNEPWGRQSMFAALPVNLDRLSAVARGYFVHPPRDDNCPPPEIGYGGRWRKRKPASTALTGSQPPLVPVWSAG